MKTSTPKADTATILLARSAALWFTVAVIGQWAYVYYIAAFYGTSTARGDFQAWDRNRFLEHGYEAGDPVGNLVFGAHVLLAGVVTFGGVLQLIPQIRARAIGFHRWNGRLFLTTAAVTAVAGVYMNWGRGPVSNVFSASATSLNAVLILAFGALAWRAARGRDIDGHRRWAMRTFMVVNGVWFFRVGLFAWILINGGRPLGSTPALDGPFDRFWALGSFLVPLAFLELFLLARTAGSPAVKLTAAGVLVVLTALMALGLFGVSMVMWRPLVF